METKIKKAFHHYTELMQHDTIGAKLVCYSVALTGFTIAMRRMRPFSRFQNPSDIPNSFIKKRRELQGQVKHIQPGSGFLMVQHKPLIALPGGNHSCLPVKVSGVTVTGNGVSWLQAIVANNTVKFIPVLKEKDCVHCIVKLPQEIPGKKTKVINVGVSLLQVGFGNLSFMEKRLVNNFEYSLYYNRLKAAEAYATRKRLGLRYYVEPTQRVLIKSFLLIGYLFNLLIRSVSKSSPRLPRVAVQ